MKTYEEMDFHPQAEKLVEILCEKTGNTNPLFFRIMVAYYFGVVASMMRCKIQTDDNGDIPVNVYSINLATSGSGKGKSTNLVEEKVINQFQYNFVESTMPLLAEENIPKLALARSQRNGTEPDVELKAAVAEYKRLGPLFFSFDSATPAAVKDTRHKLLMANCGALNFQMDEVGSNLTGNLEVLNTFLELYDVGKIKPKLVKNTAENQRNEEILGRTPANGMFFGTPDKLMNAGKTEEEFYSLLETGYARRSLFGYAKGHTRQAGLTAKQTLAQRKKTNVGTFIDDLSDQLGDMADMMHANKTLQVSESVELIFIQYELDCIALADTYPTHAGMRKAELEHRYFKAKKVAGAYAFIDGSPEITEDHAYYAIKLTEESGKAFDMMLARDKPHVKLAKYLAEEGTPVTQAEMVEDLPYYKGNNSQKADMMTLAIAYGYKNNILIKKEFNDGVEFIRGETLKTTDLDNIKISYSNDFAKGYMEESAPFDELHKMTQAPGIHWCSHAFKDGHRNEDNAIPGFNIVVLDVDHEVNLSTAKIMLKDYKCMFYTTKRHQTQGHGDRFRIIMPINYELALDAKDYKEFMDNVFQWLPFEVDDCTGQRSRKWMSHDGTYEYQDGQLLDALPFIPQTTKNEEFKTRILDQQGMDNLERWVINNTGEGNRNHMLLRFAMILVDGGFDFEGIRQRVNTLNDKLADKLSEAEIMDTIMISVAKAIAKR
jgi:hypothetical protein